MLKELWLPAMLIAIILAAVLWLHPPRLYGSWSAVNDFAVEAANNAAKAPGAPY